MDTTNKSHVASDATVSLVNEPLASLAEEVAAPTVTKYVKPELSPDDVTAIWTKAQLENGLATKLPDWAREGVAAFRKIILGRGFPCFFAPSSDRQGRLLYVFADSIHDRRDVDHLSLAIESFLNFIDKLPQFDADSTVLVVLIRPQGPERALKDYAEDANTLLSSLREVDPAPWPADVPTDLDDPKWSYALAGRALFVNVYRRTLEMSGFRTIEMSLMARGLAPKLCDVQDDFNNHEFQRAVPPSSS